MLCFERERLLGRLIGRVSNDSFMLLEQCSGAYLHRLCFDRIDIKIILSIIVLSVLKIKYEISILA